MSPIVCGTDFSTWSLSALRAALALGSRLEQEVILVHVVNAAVVDDALRAEAHAKATERIEAAVRTMASPRPIRTHIAWGEPMAELLRVAEDRHASLVIVGSAGHGHSPLFRLQATSERLAGESAIPVLVIREGESFEAWAHGAAMRVMVAVDETLSSASAIRWVEKLRRVAPLDVVLGHVYYPDIAAIEYGLQEPISMFTPDPRIEALVERDLSRRMPSLEGQGEVRYRARLGLGRTGDHLVELAEAEGCALLVVGSHHRQGVSRLWSAAAAALHVSRMSVAVVPPDGAEARVAAAPRRRHVLVTTDFSECGNSAIPWAYTLVADGGEVTLAHVWGEMAPSARTSIELAAKLRALPGAQRGNAVTRTEVLHGLNPAKAIAAAAARVGADLIVIGSHGKTGLKRAALGSVAEEVVRASTRPVFVVRALE